MRFGEFRESVAVDFLVSGIESYRDLRNALTGVDGLGAITRPAAPPLQLAGAISADQYVWPRIRALRRVLAKPGATRP